VHLLEAARNAPRVTLGSAALADEQTTLAAAEKAGAWAAWRSAVRGSDPDSLIAMISASGLRGRGGAGYPTGDKWRACREAEGSRRHVVVNGFEADPGAQLDRALMELAPHSVVEGTALAAYAVGAGDAIISVKAGYGEAVRRLTAAVRAAEEAGLIGQNALAAGFDLHIEVRPLAGSFVLGEETVLLRSLEGKRAQPDQRPPYPAEQGLWAEPTVVNNVETLAAVPWIVEHGAQAYSRIGAKGSPGTTLVQLSGAVAEPGIAEVPLGLRLGDVLERAGGSVGRLKAVLVGGPTGGFLPASGLETRLSYDALAEAGAIMGSGTVLAVDETACIVDLATLMTRVAADEACGKTIPCRIGTRRLSEIGERFTGGRPRPTDPQLLQDLAADVRDGALCALESTATNPLLTGMRYFAEEFEDHIVRSTCPAGICSPLRVAAGASAHRAPTAPVESTR
jgi:NADH:ubiquinone oxidoreductase subunit F (NADH-binding)